MNTYPENPPEDLICKCGRHLPCRHCEPSGEELGASACSRPSVCDKDSKAWTNFIRAAQHLQETLRKPHTLHELIMNDIDHCAQDVRLALDASRYFWRFDLKKKRPGATVLPAPDSSENVKGESPLTESEV